MSGDAASSAAFCCLRRSSHAVFASGTLVSSLRASSTATAFAIFDSSGSLATRAPLFAASVGSFQVTRPLVVRRARRSATTAIACSSSRLAGLDVAGGSGSTMSGVTPSRWVDEPLTRKNCWIVILRTPSSIWPPVDAIEIRERLDRALAVRRARADDHRALVVLERAGEDLRRRRAEPIDEHDHRAVEVVALVVVGEDLLLAVAVLDLHDRALVDQLAA